MAEPDEAQYSGIGFVVPGLHLALTNAFVDHLHLDSQPISTEEGEPETKRNRLVADLRTLTGANEALVVTYGPRPTASVDFEGRAYSITLATTVASSFSNVDGDTTQTRNNIWIETAGATADELLRVATEVQRFLSIFCLGVVKPEDTWMHREGEHLDLLWRLGADDASRKSAERMQHHLLAPLGSVPDVTERALKEWFSASEQRRLARWLIIEGLGAPTLTIGQFLATARAWEVIGRELHKGEKIEAKKFAKACEAAIAAMSGELGKEQAERLGGLLSGGNQPSFSRLLKAALREVPSQATHALCGDVDAFVTDVTKTRNALTHMKKSGNLKVHDAGRKAPDLTLKLITLYCLLEARALKLPLGNLQSVLDHNEFAAMASDEGPRSSRRRPWR